MKNTVFIGISVLALYLLIFTGCDKHQQQNLKELEFSVVDSLLENAIIDSTYNIKFSPPRDYFELENELREQVVSSLTNYINENVPFRINIITISADTSTSSLLIVTQLDPDNTNPEVFFEEYKQYVRQQFANVEILETEYLKDGIPITQFLTNREGAVIFKLLFFNEERELMQFDYFVPDSFYPNQIKNIESSIGSIEYYH